MYSYNKKISSLSNKELLDEEEKLIKLLNNIYQEYNDRVDTISLISSQIDQVRSLRIWRDNEESLRSSNPF